MAIKLTFLGAAGTVTGSAYLLQTNRASVLVDFGMFQGFSHHDDLNMLPATLDVAKLDAVVVTHAHLDHTGRLPLLAKAGYHGPIYATEATIPLTSLILRDSAHLQLMDIERLNRKRQRAAEPPLVPIYTAEHVAHALGLAMLLRARGAGGAVGGGGGARPIEHRGLLTLLHAPLIGFCSGPCQVR